MKKNFKRFFILLILISLLIFSLGFVSASNDSTYLSDINYIDEEDISIAEDLDLLNDCVSEDDYISEDSSCQDSNENLNSQSYSLEARAEQGNDVLNTILDLDEGARYLGECALVPQKSPICESGILFYNTLFDENAACHLAIGMGFADTIDNFQEKTLEECRRLGVNDSMIHEDFMIGCDSMNIDGICEDGSTVAIFRNGNWAF